MKAKQLLILIFLFATLTFTPKIFAQDYTTWGLPEGAKVRLGKGSINEIQYSHDGTTIASGIESVGFSPDSSIIASGSGDGTVLLWELGPSSTISLQLSEDVNDDGIRRV